MSWAHHGDESFICKGHQAGPYIHKEARDSGFFPALISKIGPKGGAKRHAEIDLIWENGNRTESSISNYLSKGEETHLTCLDQSVFSNAFPGDILTICRSSEGYFSGVIHQNSLQYDELLAMFPSIVSKSFLVENPKNMIATSKEKELEFSEKAWQAYLSGRFCNFKALHEKIPIGSEISKCAEKRYVDSHKLKSLNPRFMSHPGIALKEISREIEYGIFLEFQRKQKSLEIISLFVDSFQEMDHSDIFKKIISSNDQFYSIYLSASQSRKSRAGNSFQFHLENMMRAADINFIPQYNIGNGKTADIYMEKYGSPIILSLKKTSKERWKQTYIESKNAQVYLLTFDQDISTSTLREIQSEGTQIVVPESHKYKSVCKDLKIENLARYESFDNVITFRELFDKIS